MDVTQPDSKPTSMPWKWRILLVLLFLIPAVYFKLDGDVVTAAVCVAAGVAAFGGYRAGAASILALFAGATAAIVYAPRMGSQHERWFSEWLGTTGLTNRLVSIGILGLLVGAVVVLVVTFALQRVFRGRPQLESFDRWVGFAVGALEGVVAMALFLGGLLVIEPIERQYSGLRDSDDVRGQLVSRFILGTSDRTRESAVGPTLAHYNPFTRVPALKKVDEIQRGVRMLGKPDGIHELLEHPSIQKLQERPEMHRTIERLQSDPELQDILRSNTSISGEAMMTLMNHPAVLDLIDQPGFVDEALGVIRGATMEAMPETKPEANPASRPTQRNVFVE